MLGVSASPLRSRNPKMKTLSLFAVSIALVIITFPSFSYGQDPNWKPPGAEEAAAVEQANKQLDMIYKRLMSKLDAEGQTSLRDAQRSWIKWRDNESLLIARVHGDVGGSALRVDYFAEQAKLIRQRIEVLKGYLTLSGSN
jgi:uncharacterized protein YecT (DUF1311 family)